MLIYQIYPRSFYDSNADGLGDLNGIAQKIPYLARLGVEWVWISPFVTSPQNDFGYDVSHYCEVDPRFGTLNDFKALLQAMHDHHIKLMMDQVWCHCSDQHPWFIESRAGLKNARSDWFIWADAKPDGSPPNNWLSYFGGSAWAWDATRQQFYFHQFLESQPTFNLRHPSVRKAIMEVGRFWLDMGVDGFRLDAIHTGFADPLWRDNPARPDGLPVAPDVPADIPQARQLRLYSEGHEDVLPFLEEARTLADQYNAVLLGETGGENPLQRAVQVMGAKRLHMAYTFGLLQKKPDAALFAQTVGEAERAKRKGSTFCYTLSNHDVMRVASRWGGTERAARVALIFGLTLPGAYCMYQGEELGLPEAEVPYDKIVDPFGLAFYPTFKGRDGCRTPMPWNEKAVHAGFSLARELWLPLAEPHRVLAVDVQEKDEASMLHVTHRMIAWRKAQPALKGDGFNGSETKGDVIAFERFDETHRLFLVFNLGVEPVHYSLEPHRRYAEGLDEASLGAQRVNNTLMLEAMSVAVLGVKG